MAAAGRAGELAGFRSGEGRGRGHLGPVEPPQLPRAEREEGGEDHLRRDGHAGEGDPELLPEVEPPRVGWGRGLGSGGGACWREEGGGGTGCLDVRPCGGGGDGDGGGGGGGTRPRSGARPGRRRRTLPNRLRR